jgi:hypothetical protein
MDYLLTIAVVVPWLLTLVTSIFALFKHKENIRIQNEIIRIQTQPNIDIITTIGQSKVSKIELHIKNYGPGIARKIIFKCVEGGEFVTQRGDKLENLDIIKNGIDSLGPDKEKFFVLTDLGEKYIDEKMNVNITISITYENDKGDEFHPDAFHIRFKEYHGLELPPTTNATLVDCLAPTVNTDFGYSDCSGNFRQK